MDPALVLLAAGTLVGHGGVAWLLWSRGTSAATRMVAEAESRARIAVREELGRIDWGPVLASVPVESLLARAVENPGTKALIEQAVNYGTGAFIQEAMHRLGLSASATTTGERLSEVRATGKMLIGILDKLGLTPILDGLGMRKAVQENPRGALTLIRQLVPGGLEQLLNQAYQQWQAAQQQSGGMAGALVNLEQNLNNPVRP